MLLVVVEVVVLIIFFVVVVFLGLYEEVVVILVLDEEVDGKVGVGDGGGRVNGSSLIHRGRALLHCPEDKHVIMRGPSNRYPVGHEISALDPK